MAEKRLMGLDFGAKTVGVAVSDPLGMSATGIEIIRRERESHLRRTYARIEELIGEYDIGTIVIGLPIHLGGGESERSSAAREFGESLERRTGLPVAMWDERLTSVEAEEVMESLGIRRADFREHIDRIAAQLILEDYMNAAGRDARK